MAVFWTVRGARGAVKPFLPAWRPAEGRRTGAGAEDYFTAKALAAWALPRDAAFLWTTPDFTALSIAET